MRCLCPAAWDGTKKEKGPGFLLSCFFHSALKKEAAGVLVEGINIAPPTTALWLNVSQTGEEMPANMPQRKSYLSALILGFVVFICLVVTACSSAPPKTGIPSYVSSLQPQLIEEMRALQTPGAIIFVQDPYRGTWATTLGVGDLVTRAPMRLNDHIRIGSITKTFTGTIILQLVEEGKMGLDDPVATYQPEVPNGKNITIRELLNMTSGLFNYTEDKALDQAFLAQPDRVWKPQELLAVAFQHPPYFAPGTGFHYSNTNTILLGLIIEQITGKSLAEEMQERIFKPLGMRDTILPSAASATLPAPYPRGYASNISGECPSTAPTAGTPPGTLCDVTNVNPSWAWAAGAAISTLHDLQIWAKALATGALVNRTMQQDRLQWVQVQSGVFYGLAILNVYNFIGHDGQLPGFQSFMGYETQTNATIIVLTNLDQSPVCTPSDEPTQLPTCLSPANELAKIIYSNLFV